MSNGLAGQIDTFLKNYGSPMVGLGATFVAAGKKYRVDPRLVVGIAGAESSMGKHVLGSYNAWGWGPGKPFSSWEEGITTVTRGLSNGYISQGLTTPAKIAQKYAPASDGNDPVHWSGLVSTFMRELGASPASSAALVTTPPTAASSSSTKTTSTVPTVPSFDPSVFGIQSALVQNLQDIATRGHASPREALSNILQGALQDRMIDQSNELHAAELRQSQTPTPDNSSAPEAQPSGALSPPLAPQRTPATAATGTVSVADGANRPGVSLDVNVIDFVRRISGLFGKPLVITTGSNHNQFVAGSNPPRQSAHWTGEAADILYGHGTGPRDVDPALTALGQTALIAAGMSPARARHQTGGLFNIGRFQIIFNSGIGGNHYNHLHVGLR